MGLKILVADDHAIVRRGLQLLLGGTAGWEVAEVATADEVLPVLRREPFHILLLDITLRDRSGIDLLPAIRRDFPHLGVLMLSMHPEEQYAIRSLRAGANGYLQKDGSPEELFSAIERVASGRTYVSVDVADRMAMELSRPTSQLPHERLSAREFEVFRLIATGKSVSEIGGMLHLSVKTISTYRARIMEKTGFRSNADIVAYAVRSHLV